uniref:C2H2-type domain-containing protein n=1 Tax=Meloidogyne floridensis TaxID=298350 RepID=A0A915NYR0_9BILA
MEDLNNKYKEYEEEFNNAGDEDNSSIEEKYLLINELPDWQLIDEISIKLLEQGIGIFETLQQALPSVVLAQINKVILDEKTKNEEESKQNVCTSSQILKLFRLAQFQIEYLLKSQQEMVVKCNECNKLFLHSNFLFEHIQRKHNNNHNNINLNNLNPNSKAIKILGVKNNDFILDNNEELINNNKLNNIKRQRRGHSERSWRSLQRKNTQKQQNNTNNQSLINSQKQKTSSFYYYPSSERASSVSEEIIEEKNKNVGEESTNRTIIISENEE